MDFLVSLVGEALFELVLELFGRGAARTGRALAREASGLGEPAVGWRVAGWLIPIATGVALGLWRGTYADGSLTWGWWLAIAIVAGCAVGLTRAESTPPEPPENRWRRTFLWWPRRRLFWFLAGNLAFALAYLLTR